jgi:hypothetical protein
MQEMKKKGFECGSTHRWITNLYCGRVTIQISFRLQSIEIKNFLKTYNSYIEATWLTSALYRKKDIGSWCAKGSKIQVKVRFYLTWVKANALELE